MSIYRIVIENYKSIKKCDISLSELNVLIGENGAGKTNILEAINYFYSNLTTDMASTDIFDKSNKFSNAVKITIYYDFSNFLKISKSNSDTIENFILEKTPNNKYANFYKKIIAMAATEKDHILTIQFTQIKGKKPLWNHSYEDRFIIKSLFPLFHINTRNLNVLEWQYVWDAISELSKVSNSERLIIEEKLAQNITSETKDLSDKMQVIEKIFKDINLTIPRTTGREFALFLSKLYFSGEKFEQQGKELTYYSMGTNSVNYISLFIKLIIQIAKTKLKQPIILLDEPEISLHPSFIDELSDLFLNTGNQLTLVISTHSSRLTKNLVKESEVVFLYKVSLINEYSSVRRMRLFSQYSVASKYRITDDHVNSYFSKAILFVEGATELELFSNKYIQALFPFLKQVDVFQALSDDRVLDIMHPNKTHTETPFISLIDMDKAIGFDPKQRCLVTKKKYFLDNDKEHFTFVSKHDTSPRLRAQRNRIESMTKKLKIHYHKPFYSTNDPNFFEYTQAVKNYLSNYNFFVFSTTVEGALVNKANFEFALNFIQSYWAKRDNIAIYNDFLNYISTLQSSDQINALRLLYHGKSDLLLNYNGKAGIKSALQNQAQLAAVESAQIGTKTSGWVSEYLQEFFLDVTCTSSIKQFSAYLESESNRNDVKKIFSTKFNELYLLLKEIYGIMEFSNRQR